MTKGTTAVQIARIEQKLDDLIVQVRKQNGSVADITGRHHVCQREQAELWGRQGNINKIVFAFGSGIFGGFITILVILITGG